MLRPLVTVHTGAETIQGRKLFAEIRYIDNLDLEDCQIEQNKCNEVD